MLTIYGRAFNVGPILGRLGMDASFADVRKQARPFWLGVHSTIGHRPVRVGIHLIYGLATSCGGPGDCVDYLDDIGVNIVKQYIEPAAARGWYVILDDQLGRSNPKQEMQRMIARGYLKYDNVEVALDPEFRAGPEQQIPGIPVGSVSATEVNAAQTVLSRYLVPLHLRHRKVLMVHQFLDSMITDRRALRWNLSDVDPAIVADGFGDPATKTQVYLSLLGRKQAPRIRLRGIKLFYPNPYETAGHGDAPVMSWPQVFGRQPALGPDGTPNYVAPPPQIVIIA
ncbi:MAG TPA: hypothetical protein VF221_11755 [Chloroflexota bacterium]